MHKKYSKNRLFDVLKKNKDSKKEKIAIQNLSLSLESGHIFGLLGPNGAGKTTTIKIMICEETQTKGTVIISGHKVKSSDTQIFRLMGYCPQHDALWKEITLKEHMHLFASIRGIPYKTIGRVCDK